MLKLADIFNAPSDDEDFLGFGSDVPMETLSLEDSCESFDLLESRKMDSHLKSKYLTEQLRKIFTEDIDSENEVFEGFSSSEHEAVESELENNSPLMEEEEEKEIKSSHKKRSFRFRVALQFPNKKSAEKTSPKFCLTDSKESPFLKQTKSKIWGKADQDTSSGSEGDEAPEENSNALLKRDMNIKENKAVLAQLLAELNSIPALFPVKTPSSTPKQKKTPRRTFSEGQIQRRTNPTRNARPPEKFALENYTVSAVRFSEHLNSYKHQNLLKKRLKGGSTCHQCRQKTIDTKTICHNEDCGGVRGQFCGPCLRNRYGEDVKSALLDPEWLCPPCRGICNCSYCRKRDGRCATGALIHLAKFYGYNNVKEYLESLQKHLAVDD
ncbi:cell division cycle-associated 7-like protein isoform 7-T7 [Liasis olivaceus]